MASEDEIIKVTMNEILLNVEKRIFLQDWGSLYRVETILPEFDERCDLEWVHFADLNDVRQRMLTLLPRRMHLQLNGDALGECYAPFLCVNWWLGMPYAQFSSILGEDYGEKLQWGAGKKVFHRSSQSGGLRRHNKFLTCAKWLWVDPSEAPVYLTAGKLRHRRWHTSWPAISSFFFCYCLLAEQVNQNIGERGTLL